MAGDAAGSNLRRDEMMFLGLLWRWVWLDGPAARGAETVGEIMPPVACCPDCRRVLGIARLRSRAVYRPAWPVIFTCPCGFFKGFRQTPGEIEAMACREIARQFRLAFDLEQLGDGADFEI
jgi:hypothetical protein